MLDFNGTVAMDGTRRSAVPALLSVRYGALAVHVVTAETLGTATVVLAGLPFELVIIGSAGGGRGIGWSTEQ